MTPEAQRIAIAEFCGWNIEMSPTKSETLWRLKLVEFIHSTFHWGEWTKRKPLLSDCIQSLPNYLNDLNAMHEAVMKLDVSQKATFDYHLDNAMSSKSNSMLYYTWEACAKDMSEPLLRTIGKWEEST